MVHADNAPAHNSRMMQNFFEHNPLKRLPHPPYSPDISSSDFYRFGKGQEALIGHEIADEINLLEVVTENLTGTSTDGLQRVFLSWIESVENVITAEGALDPSQYLVCDD
jgi:histone-lysine N-methyltransferase SETMAR